MSRKRRISDLTNDEIKFIVNEIFKPKKITNIKAHKREDMISCTIYTEWTGKDDNGNEEITVIQDYVELRNPFDYETEAIWWQDVAIHRDDYDKLKSYCYIKGIYGESIKWLTDNPYWDHEWRR